MSTWKLKSTPPHDFFLCLDLESYFDHEHNPEEIFEQGFTRPIPVGERDVLVSIFFNGDPDSPEFTIKSLETLSDNEISLANKALDRILGLSLDLKPLMAKAQNDQVLADKMIEFYGFKRLARANLFEEAVNRIIQTQISHKPTARKMVYGVREAYGTRLDGKNGPIPAWPRPIQLMSADPANMKQYGLSLRKGEYVVGLANEYVAGNLDNDALEQIPAQSFYKTMTSIRGVGPTTAQDLLLYRNRPDAQFPSNIQKGVEKGLRRWIIWSYGGDPDHTSEKEFKHMIRNWKGNEALALEFLYLNWVVTEKKKRQKS